MSQPLSNQKNPKVVGTYVHPEFKDMSEDDLRRKAAEFDIDRHLISLCMVEPFYGDIIRSLHKTMDRGIPTAGVVCKDDTLYMYYNDMFLAPYSVDVIRGIMIHEALHLVLQHTTTRRYEPFEIWNWATDLAINGSIPRKLLPNIGLIPGERPAFTITPNMSQQDVDRLERIATLIASLPSNLSSEEYFSILMNSQDVQDQMAQGQMKVVGEMDDHDGWGDADSEGGVNGEYMNEKVRQIVKTAASKADAKNAWGTVPAHTREEIRRFVNGQIDWRSVLRQFVGQQQRADRINSIYRVNRKYPGIHSGFSRDHRPSIGVFLDQSGSVSDEALELFYGELPGLSRHADFTIFNFDTSVDESSATVWRKGSIMNKLVRTRCGGTDFDAVTRFLASPIGRKHKFEAVIILTDGGAPKPESARGHRRCWVLEPGTNLYFNNPDARDVVISLTKGKVKS